VSQNFAWGNIVAWLLLEPLVGGFVAYNLSVLVSLGLCGYGAFVLANELTGDWRAALIAGLLYQCWPFRLSQLDHPNLISTQWIPIFLLFLIRTIRLGKWWNGALTGVFFALVGYTRWQLLVSASILGGIYAACTLPNQRAAWRCWGPALLISGIVATLILAPPALMLITQQDVGSSDLLREGEEAEMQTDLLAYLTPGRSHSVLNPLTRPAYDRYYAERSEPRRFAAYVGVCPLILAVVGAFKTRRLGLPWLVMALAMILLALGPVLRINGQTYPNVPMPYRLADQLYVGRLLRIPDRFNMFLALPIAVLSAHGIASLLTSIQRRGKWIATAALGMLGGIIFFEYIAVPVPLIRPKASEFLYQMSTEPEEYAVLNLPINLASSKEYMFQQTIHQHPILQGNVSRLPPGAFDYLDSHPWLNSLQESGKMPPQPTDVSRQLETLAQDNVRYIILHKKAVRLAHWRRYFAVDPSFEDERIVVYATSPLAGRDFTLAEELAPGIGLITTSVSSNCLPPGQPLSVGVGWGTTAPPGENLDVRLALVAKEGSTAIEQTFPLCEGWPTAEWPANAVARENYRLDTFPLPEDDYNVLLALVGPTGAVRKRPTTVGQVAIRKDGCDLPLPLEAVQVNALFGDELRLLGYQILRGGDQLTLTLHWRADQLMEQDYKIFVHVVDPTNDLRVAQDDSKPLRWTYPTPLWNAGEVVVDAIPLSLAEAPPGSYQLLVGVYDANTKDRAPVIDGSGQLLPDARITLPEKIEVEDLDS
ncbi:MAG: hypothetical protein JXA14_19950, partial [Anaerolineae bacterium]|nr:hypothetical protein [Anaerolineae bacterium]